MLADLAVPSVSAQSAVLVESTSGDIVYEKNAYLRLPMASTTKIMTAIVAIEHADPSLMITVSPLAVGVEGSSIYLYAGEQLSLEHLLYALLLESANDAATAIAIALAGSVAAFAEWMNQKASELNLTDTHFTNPHGLNDEEHFTTAADLAKLAVYCMGNALFRQIVSTQRMTIPLHDQEGVRLLLNHNRLLRSYEGAIGLKTGFTKKSGRCLVSAAERNGVTFIAVTLNAPNDWDDHRNMLDYGFQRYSAIMLQAAGSCVRSIPVIGIIPGVVTVLNERDVCVVLPREHGEITVSCEAPRWLAGNIVRGQIIGKLVWQCDGEILATEPLIAQDSISVFPPKKTLWKRLLSLFS